MAILEIITSIDSPYALMREHGIAWLSEADAYIQITLRNGRKLHELPRRETPSGCRKQAVFKDG